MVSHMKTTLNLDDELMRAAKRRAIQEETTLTALVESALRLRLDSVGGDAPSPDELYPELSPVGSPGLAARLLDDDKGE